MKKSNLPKNWIICSSKSYANKQYYFNKVTKETSWELPVEETKNESSTKKKDNKRKLESDEEILRPKTPDMTQDKERPVLQAKRRISLVPAVQNETPQMREIRERMLLKQAKLNKGMKPTSSKESTSNDKVLNKPSVSKISSSKITENKTTNVKISQTEIKDAKNTSISENVVSSSTKGKRRFSEMSTTLPRKPSLRLSTPATGNNDKDETVDSKEIEKQNLTPQMRLLYEKMEQRKNQKPGSSRKSMSSNQSTNSSASSTSGSTSDSSSNTSSTSTSTVTSTPSSKTSKKTILLEKPASPAQIVPNPVTTRRRSRQSISSQSVSETKPGALSLPTLTEETEAKSPEKIEPEKKLVSTPSSARKIKSARLSLPQEADNSFKIPLKRPETDYPKNIAKKRLDDFQKNLQKNQLDESIVSQRRVSLESTQNSRPQEVSNTNMRMLTEDPGPEITVYTNALSRARQLEDRVLNYQNWNVNVNNNSSQEDLEDDILENQPMLAKLKNFQNDPYIEEMEWEPIEDEKIMYEVQAVRSQLYTKSIDYTNPIQENILELSSKANEQKKALYIVVDTNVFLSNLQAIEEARDIVFKSFGRPFIVIPWTVLQELDFIKDDKSATRSEILKAKARKAVRFLHEHFSKKHPRILGQTPKDVIQNREIFAVDCPDDEILQSCLQIRISGRSVVLLSYDKNLCNKAMIHDIVTLGRDDPYEKVDFLNIDNQGNSSSSLATTHDNVKTITPHDEELLVADDMFEKTKDALLNFISPIVVAEMRNLYGENWERYTIIRPPWSTKDVLKCAIKHWMAAVSESFIRRGESILKDLLQAINNPPDGGRRLIDVSYILEKCTDLLQTLQQQKYPNLMNRTAPIVDGLKKRCAEETRRICEKRIRDEIGEENSIEKQNERADIALNYFNDVYAFTRDFCGTASEALNMSCQFLFDKNQKQFSTDFVNDYQPILAANLNHLLQLLSLAMEDINGLRPDHKPVVALTEALVAFLPEEFNQHNNEITPLDVFYLIKTKQDVMKLGLKQLQDLSQQFCRMASFRCK